MMSVLVTAVDAQESAETKAMLATERSLVTLLVVVVDVASAKGVGMC